jgi:hypothetical protein
MKPLGPDVFPSYRTKKFALPALTIEIYHLILVVYTLVFALAFYVFLFYIPLLMFVMGFIIVSLVLAGALLPVHSRNDVWRFSPAAPSTERCIAGNRLDPQMSYELRSRCEVKGMRFVVAVVIFGLLMMVGACILHPQLFKPIQDSEDAAFVPSVSLFFLSFLGVAIARKWYAERRLLSKALVTLANLDPTAGVYDFCDPWGSAYGGTKKIRPENRNDNCCLVFYRPSNPNRNVPSAAMSFHRAVFEARVTSPIG